MRRLTVVLLCLFMAAGMLAFAAEKKETVKNLFPQGDMENEKIVPENDPVKMAVPAKDNADGWCGNPRDSLEFVKDAHSGKRALRITSKGEAVWLNRFVPIKSLEGTLTFWYKIKSPEKEGQLVFHMVAWSWEMLEVDARQTTILYLKEANDGRRWHKAQIDFYYTQPRDGIMLAPRIACEDASEIPVEWTIDDIEIIEKTK
ncbi:hypothetical protein AUJ67_01765 [Candidatus Desantisbacteria bacterium CG1_02_49_89]|nr:MAG: hypothetical protein AUJ67_01765 [Candidatus Desantisbacteria bacterium CG1_02_49_89]